MNSTEIWLVVLTGLGVAASVGIQLVGRGEWQGKVATKLDEHDGNIKEIKEGAQRQWERLGVHDREITQLQARVGKANGHL
jgi:hypothetical protein